MPLNERQKKRIHRAFESGNFNLNSEIENLVVQGFSQEEAARQVQTEVDAHRQNLFDQKMNKSKGDDYEKIALIITVMGGLIGPVFHIVSLSWYTAACAIAGGIGYWAYKEERLVGMIQCMCFIVTIPFTYNWYISGRSSIIKIELLIPIGLAAFTSYLVGFLISTFYYSNK